MNPSEEAELFSLAKSRNEGRWSEFVVKEVSIVMDSDGANKRRLTIFPQTHLAGFKYMCGAFPHGLESKFFPHSPCAKHCDMVHGVIVL